MAPRRIGLIVNPVAGLGGAVGLKGSDGAALQAEAIRRGAVAQAGARAARALRDPMRRDMFWLVTGSGAMGVDAVAAAGFAPDAVLAAPASSTAEDTRRLARHMRGTGVELLLFSGGDGTARDVHAAVGDEVPMLGIPSGVKMHSGVFATSPAAAGRLLAAFAAGDAPRFREAEIIDRDAAGGAPRLYGLARVPEESRLMQQAKAGPAPDDAAHVIAAAHAIAREMERDVAYVIGPGQSAGEVLAALGLSGTLLGVDVVRNGGLAGRDVSATGLRALVGEGPARIVVGVTGGQGFVFGRGNQQIPADVIGRAGRAGITILAGPQKLAGLPAARLLVDTGDAAVDAALAGHIRVRCGRDRWMMMRLVAG